MPDSYHHGDLKNALIRAGIEILSKEGLAALSLRSVAKRAGVSHAAPYAHFADKQALIAAIATAGYASLYDRLVATQESKTDPLERLFAAAHVYLQFALDEPDHFKITLSGVLEAEKNYPEYVEQTQRCFAVVVALVADCQAAGRLSKGDAGLLTVSIWASIHGFIQLFLDHQLPSTVTEQYPVREAFHFHLHRILTLTSHANPQKPPSI